MQKEWKLAAKGRLSRRPSMPDIDQLIKPTVSSHRIGVFSNPRLKWPFAVTITATAETMRTKTV